MNRGGKRYNSLSGLKAFIIEKYIGSAVNAPIKRSSRDTAILPPIERLRRCLLISSPNPFLNCEALY